MSKEKSKVLFVGRYNFTEVLSGPEKVAKRIFFEHTKHDNSIFVQYFFDGRKFGLIKKLFGKESLVITGNASVVTLGLFRILPVIIKFKPDIVHLITYERFAIIFYFWKIFSRYKIIYNSHGIISLENDVKKSSYWYSLKDKIAEKIFLKFSNVIIFPSKIYAKLALKQQAFDSKIIKVIPNGIDNIYNNKDRRHNEGNVLNIVIEAEKVGFEASIPYLTDIFKKINGRVNFRIIGNVKDCFPKIEKLKILYIDKMPSYEFSEFLKENDIFLSLIMYDSFSISTAEAMASGMIPIICKDTGIAGYITNGVNGYTVNHDDSTAVSNYINVLSCDPAKRKTISENAPKIIEKLSWDKVYLSYNEVYTTI